MFQRITTMNKQEIRLAVKWCRVLGLKKAHIGKIKDIASILGQKPLDVILWLPWSLN